MLAFFAAVSLKTVQPVKKNGLPKADRRNTGAAPGLHLKGN
jgi:hypothetical protein